MINIKQSKILVYDGFDYEPISCLPLKFKKKIKTPILLNAKIKSENDFINLKEITHHTGPLIINFNNLGFESKSFDLILNIKTIDNSYPQEEIEIKNLKTKDAFSIFFSDYEKIISYIILELEDNNIKNTEKILDSIRKSLLLYHYKDYINNIEEKIKNLNKKISKKEICGKQQQSILNIIKNLKIEKDEKNKLFKFLEI